MSPLSVRDSPALGKIAGQLRQIAKLLEELEAHAAQTPVRGTDHSAALSGIQTSLDSIAGSLKGIASRP